MTEAIDIGMPINAPADPGHGWRPITETSPPIDGDKDILLCIAWLACGEDDERTGIVTRWQAFVGRRLSRDHFDEPESMTSKPSASWLGDSEEYADIPSYWQPAAQLPDVPEERA